LISAVSWDIEKEQLKNSHGNPAEHLTVSMSHRRIFKTRTVVLVIRRRGIARFLQRSK
jgi:hypothetical protein